MHARQKTFPGSTLLVDTYDTLEGVRRVIALAREPGERFQVRGVRLGSGDLGALAREARPLLDAAGLGQVEIFASGSLDEHEIERLVAGGAPIDGFGVGTRMGVSEDAPSRDMAYKLSAYAGSGRLKLSPRKSNLPGPKQVFRALRDGRAAGDVIGVRGEALDGRPLLVPVMRAGRRTEAGADDLAAARQRAREELCQLPEACLGLREPEAPYPVALSAALAAETTRLRSALRTAPPARNAPEASAQGTGR